MTIEKLNLDRDVILDLFPVYLAGEASPATRPLVEDYLRKDTDLAAKLKLQWAENFSSAIPGASGLPELELRTLRRTRKLMTLRSWLLGLAIGFTATAFSFSFFNDGGRGRVPFSDDR